VLDQLPDEPVDAVGFSLGGRTLLLAASQAPERFGRLVVMGIGANALGSSDHTEVSAAIEAGDTSHPIARYFLEHGARSGTPPAAIARLLGDAGPSLTPERLAGVAVPTLVVIGERDHAGPGQPLADALPDARCVTLPGVDHFSTPKAFGAIDATLEFLGAV
jgi:pimeloyl-ACP methyl ester carboxylesterase